MCIGIDITRGTAISIEFMRNGEHHRSIRWCSDETLIEALDDDYIQDIRQRYTAVGAEVLKIASIETTEVCLG